MPSSDEPKANSATRNKQQQHHSICAAVAESAEGARLRRERRRSKAQPWIVLKFTILVAFGILGLTSYVFVGRLCVPRLKDTGDSTRLAEGIALLVVYAILFLMVLWCYVVVVVTPPGKAVDHVPPAPKPEPTYVPPTSAESFHASEPYDNQDDDTTIPSTSTDPHSHKPVAETSSRLNAQSQQTITNPTPHVKPQPTIPPSESVRRPPTTPILLPEWRYCYRESIIKPYRTHHCRACGTCILRYDHHCPWIGQCVGARNHKFFIIFNFWAAIFAIYVLGTLIGITVVEGSNNLDPAKIVVIALAGLFFLFTASLYATHIRMACLNQTTVESLAFRDMKERESEIQGCLCGNRSQRRLSDAEWGRIDKEGNLWWKEGGWRVNFEEVMGHRRLGWILPIGRPALDGLNFTPNPRFDAQGRWRRRAEWPVELQNS